MSRHQHERMKARAKAPEKVDPVRQKEAEELRSIIGTTRTILFVGILISLPLHKVTAKTNATH